MNVSKQKIDGHDIGDYTEKGTSLWVEAWHRLRSNKLALLGLIIIILLLIVSILGPFLAKYNYFQQNLVLGASAPSFEHWCGTDMLGRDLLVRIMYGTRVSLAVGICATLVSLTIGVFYGAVSGYSGGRTDALMMRFVDIMYALPFTMLVIILMVWFGRNFILIFVAIGIIEWLTMARIVRGEVLSLKKMEFIDAAKAIGLSKRKIICRHVIPNILGVVIVYATLTIPRVMMIEAFLSFLGLGIQPPMSSLGLLIRDGAQVMEEYPWMLFFPGIIFSISLFAFNFVGDGLRDAIDPKMNKK
ncbi:MAG TPA: ABC transporter permease [Victivallales bacterium]|nr:ABC transporter permease [Victivallales bacterium]